MKIVISCALIIGLIFSGVTAAAKPKVCFTKAEENAEQLVRGGLRMREGAAGCDGPPWEFHTKPIWDQVDQRYGAKFKQQTDIRRRAFQREFANDVENNEREWDGRTVLHFRFYPLSVAYCTEVKTNMENMLKKGWKVFVQQAQRAADEVEMDYEKCK